MTALKIQSIKYRRQQELDRGLERKEFYSAGSERRRRSDKPCGMQDGSDPRPHQGEEVQAKAKGGRVDLRKGKEDSSLRDAVEIQR